MARGSLNIKFWIRKPPNIFKVFEVYYWMVLQQSAMGAGLLEALSLAVIPGAAQHVSQSFLNFTIAD